jgi:outer membrane lipoprotein-sorting protein
MATPDEADVLRRLERLAGIEPEGTDTARAIERTRAALLNPTVSPGLFLRRKVLVGQIAAAVLFLAGIAGLIGWLLSAGAGASLAFGDVQEKMRSTRTLTFQLTREEKGRPVETDQILIRAPNLLRVELQNGGVTITDYEKHQSLLLDPAKKEAKLIQGLALQLPNIYDKIRNAPKEAVKRLPEKEVDGKKAVGFVVPIGEEEHKAEATVWVDPKTQLPFRMEITDKNPNGTEVRQVLSELVFDRKLDEGLFSLTPPQGYTLQTVGLAKLPPPPGKKELLSPVVTPLVGIGPARFGMSKEQVIEALGQPDDIPKEGRGSLLSYFSRGYSVTVSPVRGLVMIDCVSQKTFLTRVRDFSGKTKEGITIGSSLKAVEEAYGKPDSVNNNGPSTKYLDYRKLSLNFVLFDDKVVGFMIQAP